MDPVAVLPYVWGILLVLFKGRVTANSYKVDLSDRFNSMMKRFGVFLDKNGPILRAQGLTE